MPVYLHAEIHAVPGRLGNLLHLIQHRLKPLLEAEGLRLVACYTGISGRRNTVVDIWELDDMDHFRKAYATTLETLPPDNELRIQLSECVESETLTFLDRRF